MYRYKNNISVFTIYYTRLVWNIHIGIYLYSKKNMEDVVALCLGAQIILRSGPIVRRLHPCSFDPGTRLFGHGPGRGADLSLVRGGGAWLGDPVAASLVVLTTDRTGSLLSELYVIVQLIFRCVQILHIAHF